MNKPYQIRAATAEDVGAVIALERKTDTLPHWRDSDYVAALCPVHRQSPAIGTTRCMFVAERNIDAVFLGFAVGKTSALDSGVIAELESIGVAKLSRRAGVGSALCEAVIAWATDSGATLIELEVRSRSAGPIALYERFGFVATGRRASYYRAPADDAILMRLILATSPEPQTPNTPDL